MNKTHSHLEILFAKAYIRQAQLIPDILPFSSATLWRKVKSGDFPRPTKLSERITAWSTESVRIWLESKEHSQESHEQEATRDSDERLKGRGAV